MRFGDRAEQPGEGELVRVRGVLSVSQRRTGRPAKCSPFNLPARVNVVK